MIDSMPITIRWNNLFDWRFADTGKTDILKDNANPGTYILSAKAWGLKGKLPGARHCWLTNFDGKSWRTFEITDIETVEVQRANIIYAEYKDPCRLQLIVSDRDPGCLWFGNIPRIDYSGNLIDIDYRYYPMNLNTNLVSNNCNTFISYIVWKYNLQFNKRYIGYKNSDFWTSKAR